MSFSRDMQRGGKKNVSIHRVAEQLVAMLPPPRRKRVNLVLSERHIDRLERLERLTDSTSIAEVVRDALFVYETLVGKLLLGSSLKELTAKNELFPLELGIDVHRRMLEPVREPSATDNQRVTRRQNTRKIASS